jgi:hypothetical protein
MIVATLSASALFASRLSAQAGLGQLEDVTLAPKGLLRLRAISAWTRYDSRFGATGTEPLGASFTADSLGPRQMAALSAIESRVQSAGAIPSFTLSLGRSQLDASAREEVFPLVLEYGVSRRFAVGVVVPIVRKRAAMLFRLDTAGGFGANVGPNRHRTDAAAEQVNALVQSEFANAASQLQTRLDACLADPAAPGCATIIAEAPALIQSSQSFASTVAELYGSLTSAGMAFVPTTESAAQFAIASRVADFNTRYRALLGASADVISAVPVGAGGPAGPSEFHNFLVEDLGRDSLTLQERVGIGDVEIGFKFLVLDRPRTERRRTGIQLAVAGGVRLPTGSRQSPSGVTDLRLGDGSLVVDSRAALDARAGRFGLLAVGQFAASVHDVDTTNISTRNSRWTEVHLSPRWHLSEPFAVHGAYSLRTTDKLGGDQLVGGGVSYSNLARYTGGRSMPMEMRFTHLEAISGDAGRPKFFREQIEVRIYYRLRR